MKVVFLTDIFYPNFGANSLVVKTIAEEFVKDGHQVAVIPFVYDKTLPKTDNCDGIKVERIIASDDKKSFAKNLFHGRIITALKIGIKYIKTKLSQKRNLSLLGNISARRTLLNYLKKEKVDAIVSICCSIELSFPLLTLRKKGKLPCKWIFYMIDPFESHQYYRSIEKVETLRKIQHEIMSNCDAVIATNLIYSDTKQWETDEILKKITIIEFPKIQKCVKMPCKDEIILDKDKINIVCTGTKNEIVRSSKYAFKLFDLLDEKNVNVHFVGFGWCDKDYDYGDKYFLHTPRSHNAIKNLQIDADYLLNIGNVITNQLPSKVLEYISVGKPIINLYKAMECPTISLLSKCESLNLNENESVEINVARLKEYILSKHENISFDEIEKIFVEYTPRFVADKFISTVIKEK